MPLHLDSDEPLIWSALGVGVGVYLFFSGFRELKCKRIIQDIPTSKIATGAVGSNVEIAGHVVVREAGDLVTAPISGIPSVFYSLEIQKLVRQKNNSYWKTIDQFYSHDEFIVDDGSGALARVMVQGADIRHKGRSESCEASSSNFDSMPPLLRTALSGNASKLGRFKLDETSWLFSDQYKFVEWSFAEDEPVYVLGYADSGLKAPQKLKLKLQAYLQAMRLIENNPELQKRFDVNRDGVLEQDEKQRGAKQVGLKIQLNEKQEAKAPLNIKLVFRLKKPSPFIISNMKETELVRSISLYATLKVFGGPVLTAAGLAYIYSVLAG